MGCELFEIGILRPDALMLLRSRWSANQIDAAIGWLRRGNVCGAHIFVRPHGAHALSLVDDLNVESIARMTDGGFQPAVIIETSPGNFQVWLNHGQIIPNRTLAPRPRRNWHVASAVMLPAPIGGTSADSRASLIRSRRGACGADFHLSYDCMNARGILTPQHGNSWRK
jgi:hypothetical protein